MSYHSNLALDTRTCGEADEDAWLDKRDGLTGSTVHETEIKYNRLNRDYDLFLDGRYVGSAANHHDGENTLNQLVWDEMVHAAALEQAPAPLAEMLDAARRELAEALA